MSHTMGVFLDELPASKAVAGLEDAEGQESAAGTRTDPTQSSLDPNGPSSLPLPEAGGSGTLLGEAGPPAPRSFKASPWKRSSHTKGAVSSPAHLGLRANEEVAKVFHFLSLFSLKKKEVIYTDKQTPPCPGRETLRLSLLG